MLWIAIFVIVVLIFTTRKVNRNKAELNDEDLLLFYKYKEMMKGKVIAKMPGGMSEWERHIWILASQERDNESQKKAYQTILYIGLGAIIIAIIIGIG